MEDKKNTSRDLFPGALEMMILECLRRQPAHGYALVQHIQQRSNNLLQVEEGSLYPALQRLLKAKLVKAEWTVSPSTNRRVRIYEITKAPVNRPDPRRKYARNMTDTLRTLSAAPSSPYAAPVWRPATPPSPEAAAQVRGFSRR